MEREQIRISVRNLVEFILRSGDIDNRRASLDTMEAMQAGSRLHRKIQKKMGSTYHAEVPLNIIIEEENYIRTPFTIRANKTEKLEKGDKGKFEISIEWPATDAQLTNKDDIDSAWGYSFSKYLQYCNENNIDLQSAISITMEIDAVQYVE